jgi:hypothetical protein
MNEAESKRRATDALLGRFVEGLNLQSVGFSDRRRVQQQAPL